NRNDSLTRNSGGEAPIPSFRESNQGCKKEGPGGPSKRLMSGEDHRALPTRTLFRLLRRRLDLLSQLLELLGEAQAEALDRGLDAVDAELGGQLVFFEQVVVAR